MQSIRASRDNETKSSAGDKYETGRAMMQAELDKSEMHFAKLLHLKKEMEQIDVTKKYDRVEKGSLVFTNRGNYFLSIPEGKIELDDKLYYAISILSPIGSKLLGASIHDIVDFKGPIHVIDIR